MVGYLKKVFNEGRLSSGEAGLGSPSRSRFVDDQHTDGSSHAHADKKKARLRLSHLSSLLRTARRREDALVVRIMFYAAPSFLLVCL
jgi:hypothetical protein